MLAFWVEWYFAIQDKCEDCRMFSIPGSIYWAPVSPANYCDSKYSSIYLHTTPEMCPGGKPLSIWLLKSITGFRDFSLKDYVSDILALIKYIL